MHSPSFHHIMSVLATTLTLAHAQSVSGTPEGFAAGTTGGAAGSTVTPSSTDELVSYLGSSDPLTIVLSQTFDFTGTEGTTSGTGCAPWGTGSGCQLAINQNDWCTNYEASAPSVAVTYDNAAITPITVAGDKTLLGVGTSGIIKGKGLKIAGGVSNVIIQNIAITDLNPQYVWGGDAITLDGSSKVWIDHVKTSLIGRQHIVSGYDANTAVTISNCEIDGVTSWSATCDGHHYWALYFTGQGDQITFKGNYIHHTSGRSPKIDEGSFVHLPNNYWYANSGHAFEGADGYALVEGSVFQDVVEPESDWSGAMFAPTSDSSACESALGRDCPANIFGSSGTLSGSDTSVLDQFGSLEVADAVDAASAQSSVPDHAGVGTSSSSSVEVSYLC